MADRFRTSSAGMNVGSTSIVMIFAVLCLTVFAVLSLATANTEKTLAEKSAQAVTDYYAADCRAVDRYHALAQSLSEGNCDFAALDMEVTPTGGFRTITYTEPVDDSQQLLVTLSEQNGTLTILTWQVVTTDDWQADETLGVWNGE